MTQKSYLAYTVVVPLCFVAAGAMANSFRTDDVEKLHKAFVSGAESLDGLSDMLEQSQSHTSMTCFEVMGRELSDVTHSLGTVMWLVSDSALMRNSVDEKILNSSIVDNSTSGDFALTKARKMMNRIKGLCSRDYGVISKADEILLYFKTIGVLFESVKHKARQNAYPTPEMPSE